MFCKKCGKEVKEGAAFCDSCGAPMNQGGGQQGTLPPMNTGYGAIGSGSLAGGGSGTGNANGKNKMIIIGAAAVALVLVIGLGIALFSGKSEGIEGTWEWECSLSEIGSLAGEFPTEEEMEEMGIKMSDLPNLRGTLEFSKDGKWEFSLDEEHYMKAAVEMVEIMLDAMLEEGYMDEDEAEDTMAEIKEMMKDEEMMEEALEELSVLEWSGDYEADAKKEEIELTIKKAYGEKESGEVVLEYEIDGEKLSLDIEEDEEGYMDQWEGLGIFDGDLTRI